MDSIFAFLAFAALVAGVVLLCMKMKKSAVLAFIGAAFLIVASGIVIIPTGYVGVRSTLGQVNDGSLSAGFHLKIPFVQTVDQICIKQSDTVIDSEVWGESSEKTPVYASDITITYQLNPAKVVWLYKTVSADPSDVLSYSLVSSAVKSAMVSLATDEVTVRNKIEPMTTEHLQAAVNDKYGEEIVQIIKTTVNQMDFEASYNDAIAAKSVARQQQEKQAIENQTAIAKAEADKKVAVAQAEAAAESAKIAAQAEADVIAIKAQAEADANRKIAESLTDSVLKNKFYDQWDGKLPSVMGQGTVITDISD